jgi:hypothetical protein
MPDDYPIRDVLAQHPYYYNSHTREPPNASRLGVHARALANEDLHPKASSEG